MTEMNAIVGKLPGDKICVEAEETKLKGYSKFRFFCFKLDRNWVVCEWTSGRQVSEGINTTLANAKKAARQYISKNIEGNLEKMQRVIVAAIKDTGKLND
jgi:hypothetical protein